ncbi:FecR family protein [Mariniphaga anaerophila]|uniref:FecR family protein n=1 Tax=Mariniphaga anaerophila TaxID=1484053 RepID=A0A1M5EET7_9BACT|nr:FecR domain-containing protein [Mariniphaga anaerophila]SHF77706.1 FecR family protein [Mariniphaga anaerophila]
MNQETDITQIILRYLNGECNIADRQTLTSWLKSSGKNQKTFYEMKDVWDASLKKEDNSRDALLRFYKQKATKNSASVKSLRLWKTVAGIAAVFIVGLMTILFLNEQPVKIHEGSYETTMMSFKVPFGSKSEVTLADGSTVVLNSGSELTYPGTFTGGKREVSLLGEAFFNVKANENEPFVVRTDHFNIQVTGTQFNVCSYTDDDFSKVSLLEGKVGVLVGEGTSAIDIVPGQQFYLNEKERKYRVLDSDVGMESSWKDGEFRFKEIAFPELLKRLERWYDVKLSYSSPELGKMLYNGNFRNQETIWQVLDGLKLTTSIDYKKTGFRKFEIIYKPMK